MKVNIHLNTVKNYYEKKFNKKVEGKIFANDIIENIAIKKQTLQEYYNYYFYPNIIERIIPLV